MLDCGGYVWLLWVWWVCGLGGLGGLHKVRLHRCVCVVFGCRLFCVVNSVDYFWFFVSMLISGLDRLCCFCCLLLLVRLPWGGMCIR